MQQVRRGDGVGQGGLLVGVTQLAAGSGKRAAWGLLPVGHRMTLFRPSPPPLHLPGYSSMEELAAELVAMQQRNFMLFKHVTQAQLETEANRQAAAGFRREAAATRDAVAAARQAQKCAELARVRGRGHVCVAAVRDGKDRI